MVRWTYLYLRNIGVIAVSIMNGGGNADVKIAFIMLTNATPTSGATTMNARMKLN